MMSNSLQNEKGIIRTLPLLVIIAAVGIISFLLISSTIPFKGNLFSKLFGKPFSHAATITNILSNGGFESGGLDWGITATNACINCIYISSSPVHSGSFAARSTGGDINSAKVFSTTPGTTYKVTGWVYLANVSGGTWGGPAISATDFNWTALGGTDHFQNYVPFNTWYAVAFSFTAISNQTRLNIGNVGDRTVDVSYDDIQVFEKPAINTPPSINSMTASSNSIASLPNTVNFTSSASDIDGAPSYWAWDFGDGGKSSQINPKHTFTSNGTYVVKLIVGDDDGGTASSTTTVTVNDTAYPSLSISSPTAPTITNAIVNFSGTALAGTGSSVSKVIYSTDRGLVGTATGTTNWSFSLNLTGMGGRNRVTIFETDTSGKTARLDFIINYQPAASVSIINGAAGVSANASSIEQFGKFEASFNIQNTQASNLYLPYDPSFPVGGLAGTGITVNGIFTSPTGKIYTQPGFLYQPYTRDTTSQTLIATGFPLWKLRFSPQETGSWTYQIKVQDASGSYTLTAPVLTFNATPPTTQGNHGFLHVSQKDHRYFEFSDGTAFIGVGPGAHIGGLGQDSFAIDKNIAQVGNGGANFSRDWMSGNNISGSSWAPWSSGLIFQGSGDNHPAVNLTPNESYGDGIYSLNLSTDPNVGACTFFGFYGSPSYVKPNTNYRILIRLKTVGVTGSGGFTFRPQAAFPSNCNIDAAKPLTIPYETGTKDWHVVAANWNSGTNNSLGYGLMTLENVTAGNVYIDEVSIKEDLGNGNFGPEVMPRPSFNVQNYFSQQPSWDWDYGLDQFSQHNLYEKAVIEEKSDYSYSHISPIGYGYDIPDNNRLEGSTGAMLKYQQAFWRYLIARYGYSRSIHSWEFANEQAPGNLYMAEQLASYMHANDPHSHMANSSNWAGLLEGDWANPVYKDVDYADAHAYVQSDSAGQPTTSWIGTTDPFTGGNMGDDSALYTSAHSIDQYKKNAAGNKPIVIGELGVGNSAKTVTAGNDDNDVKGVWLHQWLWPQMNYGGAYMIYWYDQTIQSHNLYPLFNTYRQFMEGKSTDTVNTRIPLNNGLYQDIVLTLPTGVNGWGQKDTTNGGAHFWAYDRSYSWTAPAGGSSLAGKAFSFIGMPAKNYTVEFWDTWNNTVTTQSLNFSGGTMTLTIPAGFNQKDVAVKIYPTTGYTAVNPGPIPTSSPTPTPAPSATPRPSTTPPSSATPAPSASPNPCNGADVNHDGIVNLLDYSIVVSNFGKSEPPGTNGDINGNGVVDLLDYSIVVSNFGKTGC